MMNGLGSFRNVGILHVQYVVVIQGEVVLVVLMLEMTQQCVLFVRDNNCTIEFDAFSFLVKDFMTRRVLLRCNSTGDLYPVTAPSSITHVFLVSQHTWHQHLGHPESEVLCRLVSNNSISCNKEKALVLCHAC
ncbi:hypothetical protein Tco_0940105 [Tanacetum coccineum]|uniref:GAG-pre-integrase domain-containing protein n=1 Tax=Tanacetum coccineum TaxID=301880 RepID=A0ABQ5DMI4_9ASTR